MAILIHKDSKVLVQGITGKSGSLQAKLMMEAGTQIVAGVTPGKGGQEVHGVPVYNFVAEAKAAHPEIDTVICFVPPRAAMDSAMEAIDAGIKLLVLTTEEMPTHDVMKVIAYAKAHNTTLVGPGCSGIIVPGVCKVGSHPVRFFAPGKVGVVSKSGALSYEIGKTLSDAGIGQSTVAGIGGGPLWGFAQKDAIALYEADPDTKVIVMLGEIGGSTEEEAAAAPAGTETKQGVGATKAYRFKIQVSPLDCTGCGNCANVCPAPTKALLMKPLESQLDKGEAERWEYMHNQVGYKDTVVDKTKTVKNSQFSRPLFEFSGACAGCGETPYIKAITQLYGDRMVIANATGCSSIYGGSAPSSPYCANEKGFGPAWANSLFEDNAEFGLGIHVGIEKLRERLIVLMKEAIEGNTGCSDELKGVMQEWLDKMDDAEATKEIAGRLIPMMEACGCDVCKQILAMKHYLIKKSTWIFGGDGWAYDIGFGGLDHVIASGMNVNILVLDTEVYSNTGGQSSKSTPIGAVAKFASAGKRVRKKDLGAMAMTYGYVYVAQVAMGANHNQYLNAIKEAEAYDGPSLIIAYAPCINHGIKGGMGKSQLTEKEAVECGYWHLWRFNPALEAQGKNPFSLDSKEPDWSKFQQFIHSEVRYTSLLKSFPDEAKELFAASEKNAQWRYETYKRYAAMDYSDTVEEK